MLQLDTCSASPTRDFDLVVTPPGVGALAHPRRLEGEILEDQRVQVPEGSLAGLRQVMGRRAFARPGNDRGTTRPQLVVEGVFSRLLAEGLAIAGAHAAAGPEAAATARVDVLASVAERARALVVRTC